MFSTLTFQLSYLLITFTNTVLAHTATTKTKSKGFFKNIPFWLLGLIILLGIIDFLLVIYLIWKFFKRRNRQEDEGHKQTVNKEEKTAEKLETTHSVKILLEGDDVSPSSPSEENLSTAIHLTSEMNNSSLEEEVINFTLVPPITKCDSSSKEEDPLSTPMSSTHENYSSTTVDGFTSSICSLSENKQASEVKEAEKTTCFDISREEKSDVENVEVSSNSTHHDVKIIENIVSQGEDSEKFKEEEMNDGDIDLDYKEEQEHTPVQETNEIPKKSILETNGEDDDDSIEKISGDIKNSENFEEKIIVEEEIIVEEKSFSERDFEETVVAFDDMKNESVTDSFSVEFEEISDSENVATAEGLLEEDMKVSGETHQQTPQGEILVNTTEGSETTIVVGTSSEDKSSNSKENLNQPEEQQISIKTRIGSSRKNLRPRRLSKISSSVLKEAGKNLERGSSEDGMY